jgi:hypothetical protein
MSPDVAAGAAAEARRDDLRRIADALALPAAAGGSVRLPSGEAVRFNQRRIRLPGLVAASPGLLAELVERFQEEGVHA